MYLAVDCVRVLPAQEPKGAPTFDVATIRPSDPDASRSNLNLDVDGITSKNLPLTFLLQFAYNLNSGSKDQMIGTPAWADSRPFDISAKEDEDTAKRIDSMPSAERVGILRTMLQKLLEDRFQLKVHHETRQLPVLALVVVKSGPKLHKAADDDPNSAGEWRGLHNMGRHQIEGREATLQMLVDDLSAKAEIGGRLVIDETGLSGTYNFELKWSSEQSAQSADENAGPTLFTAIQEQLGLKLESKKAAIDCLIIDHVEQPSPN